MPKIKYEDIRGYIQDKKYYCFKCGIHNNAFLELDNVLTEADLDLPEHYGCTYYCDECRYKIY